VGSQFNEKHGKLGTGSAPDGILREGLPYQSDTEHVGQKAGVSNPHTRQTAISELERQPPRTAPLARACRDSVLGADRVARCAEERAKGRDTIQSCALVKPE
jgi:hypothetical protein